MAPFVDALLAHSTQLLGATAPAEVLGLTCGAVQRVTGVGLVFGTAGTSATWASGVHQRCHGSDRTEVDAAQRSALFAIHRALSHRRGPVKLSRNDEPTIVGALCGTEAASRDVVAFPIVHTRGRLSGLIAVCAADDLSEEAMAFVIELARLAGLGLDHVHRIASARRDRERLRLLAEAAEEALWDWSRDTGEFWWGGGVHTLLGDVVVQSRLSWKFEQVHPEDRERVRASFERALDTVDAAAWREEYRQRRTDGTWICVEDHAHVLRDSSGRAYRVVGALRDVTELRGLLAREQAARAEAERASLAKDEFLAILGHELRNPLSPIVSALHVLRKGGSREATDRGVAIIERQARHLTRLVDDLLDVARIAKGKVHLHHERVDLADVIDVALETANTLIEERRHVVEVQTARGLMVDADRARMEQVIGNLITNAAKYTPPGGRIVVRACSSNGFVEVRVVDSGIGIAAEMLPRVFETFVQAEQTLDRTRGGLGLGLAIVRNLVLLHGGTVQAASEGEGQGAEFIMRLPAAESVPLAVHVATPVEIGHHAPRRVLIVDDNCDSAEAMAAGLAQLGHVTRVMHDGTAALSAVAEFDPDVVLLDLGLPIIDGYEVARRLRQRHVDGRPRLIAVTGYGLETDRAKTRDAGFDGHLVKPVQFQRLHEVIVASPALPPVSRGDDTESARRSI